MEAGPRIGPRERLSATVTLSIVAHAVIILGLGFTLDDAATVTPTLDVILSQTSTLEPPKDADFLAQANNRGGGDRDRAERPRENQLGVVYALDGSQPIDTLLFALLDMEGQVLGTDCTF